MTADTMAHMLLRSRHCYMRMYMHRSTVFSSKLETINSCFLQQRKKQRSARAGGVSIGYRACGVFSGYRLSFRVIRPFSNLLLAALRHSEAVLAALRHSEAVLLAALRHSEVCILAILDLLVKCNRLAFN